MGTHTIPRNTHIKGTVQVDSDADLNGALDVAGAAVLNGTADIKGALTAEAGAAITGDVTTVDTLTGSSGTKTAISHAPTVNQSGTAGYTAVNVNVTETATGSGAKSLLNLAIAGVAKLNVDDTGKVKAAAGIAAFNHAVPGAQPSVTGALSTVADAPAKAVLTAIIAVLTGSGLATDGTT